MTTPMAVFPRWILDDGLGRTYSFRTNPNQMSSPWEDINVTAAPTVAPDGAMLLTEGARQAKEMTISGVILEKPQYIEMVAWLKARRRVYLIDHLGRRMVVFIKSFSPTPMRRTTYKHTYEMVLMILSGPIDFVETTDGGPVTAIPNYSPTTTTTTTTASSTTSTAPATTTTTTTTAPTPTSPTSVNFTFTN